jgi:hypothetical protein
MAGYWHNAESWMGALRSSWYERNILQLRECSDYLDIAPEPHVLLFRRAKNFDAERAPAGAGAQAVSHALSVSIRPQPTKIRNHFSCL